MPPPPVPPAGAEPPDNEAARRRVDVRITVITAIATILAALIGGIAAVKAGAVDITLNGADERDELASTVSSLEVTNDSLETTNSSLQEALDEATRTTTTRATTTTTDAETTGVTTNPSPTASQVLRESAGTPLMFSWGYSADLDSTEPNWDVRQGDSSPDEDLYVGSSGRVYAGEVTLMDHVPTEAECRDATVRQPSLPEDKSVAGTMFCMTTGGEHWAFVRIAALDTEAETASFDVIVWQ